MKFLTLAKLMTAAVAVSAASFAVAEPITFTDQNDRTVTIDGVAERVVTIPIPAASLFMSVDGGTDKLAGMHPLSKTAIKGQILESFYPDAMSVSYTHLTLPTICSV